MNLTVTTHQAEEDIRNEQLKIYVNGEIIPKLEAKISVFDSGFMLGDGVWEFSERMHPDYRPMLFQRSHNDQHLAILSFYPNAFSCDHCCIKS